MSKENKRILIVVGICLLLLLLAIMIVLLLKPAEPALPQNSDPTGEQIAVDPTKPTESTPTQPGTSMPTDPEETDPTKPDPTKPTKPDPTKPTEPDPTDPEPTEPKPTDPPPVVVIPDGDEEEEGLQFPCDIPGYDLRIEKLGAYTGLFVEDGSNTEVSGVSMLLLCNNGDKPVEYTEITVKYEKETLVFHVTALPVGARMVVQEKDGQKLPEGVPLEAKALIVRRADMEIAPELSVTDNGDNALIVKNLTDKPIPSVRVFYKYYMEEENLFVGGIAFTVRITNLGANESTVIHPSHYMSKTSRVVMALPYDS